MARFPRRKKFAKSSQSQRKSKHTKQKSIISKTVSNQEAEKKKQEEVRQKARRVLEKAEEFLTEKSERMSGSKKDQVDVIMDDLFRLFPDCVEDFNKLKKEEKTKSRARFRRFIAEVKEILGDFSEKGINLENCAIGHIKCNDKAFRLAYNPRDSKWYPESDFEMLEEENKGLVDLRQAHTSFKLRGLPPGTLEASKQKRAMDEDDALRDDESSQDDDPNLERSKEEESAEEDEEMEESGKKRLATVVSKGREEGKEPKQRKLSGSGKKAAKKTPAKESSQRKTKSQSASTAKMSFSGHSTGVTIESIILDEEDDDFMGELEDFGNAIVYDGFGIETTRLITYGSNIHTTIQDETCVKNVAYSLLAYAYVGANLEKLDDRRISDKVGNQLKKKLVNFGVQRKKTSKSTLTLPRIAICYLPAYLALRCTRRNNLQNQTTSTIDVVYKDPVFIAVPEIANMEGYDTFYEEFSKVLEIPSSNESEAEKAKREMRKNVDWKKISQEGYRQDSLNQKFMHTVLSDIQREPSSVNMSYFMRTLKAMVESIDLNRFDDMV